MNISSAVKKIIDAILPLKNYILLESFPDVSDNTLAVFEELLRRKVNEKYKIIWMLNKRHSDNEFKQYKNVKYIYRHSKIGRIYRKLAKFCVSSNDFLASIRDKQYSLFLTHGTTLKIISHFYTMPDNMNKIIASSEKSDELLSEYFVYNRSRAVVTGYPRNDVFSKPPHDLKQYFGEYSKYIIWFPTFKKMSDVEGLASGQALPIIHNKENAFRVNEIAKKNNILIIIKPHFRQDISELINYNLSNIVFINDKFFIDNNITSYEFLNSTDALITDYSSVYFDYLLHDKPIAVVWEDIEDYKKNPGLVNEYEYYVSGAEKINNVDEMETFLINVATDNDILLEERTKMRDEMNISTDGKNSERVVDYLLSEIEKRK